MRRFLHRFPAVGGLLLLALLCAAIASLRYATARQASPELVPTQQSTLIVTNTNDNGPGSLRQALADAVDGDTIQFLPALNGQTIHLINGQLVINNSITVSGPGPALLTVARDQQASESRIFSISPGHTVGISGLTVSNGRLTNENGGGISNDHATLTITDCVISMNRITFGFSQPTGGGGVYNSGTLALVRSRVMSNGALSLKSGGNAAGGGGLLNSGTLTITQSNISNNSADGTGGGISNNGMLTITDSTVDSNVMSNIGQSDSNGGGIANGGTLIIQNSTVSNNSTAGGGKGGGFYDTGSLEVTNCTISSNTAHYGGGIHGGGVFGNSSAIIRNSTISSNRASSLQGGSIYVYGLSTVELGNTILKADQGANISRKSGTVTSHGYNICSDNGAGLLTGPGDQINTDPLLGPLQNNGGPTFTHELLPGSPAINAGDPNFTPPPFTDQRGYLRVFNGRIDIGSLEAQPAPPTPTPGPVTHFAVVAPGAVVQYFSFDVTVTALDQFNNTVTDYAGIVHFTSTSTGNGTHLPADSTLTNGTGTFSAQLGSAGNQTITATDTNNPSITGTSNPIFVVPEGPSPTPSPTPSDTWTPTSLTNAPVARDSHTAVWTGSEMIVWGGCTGHFCSNFSNTGGRYNPSTDSWTAISTSNAPTARTDHTAVWTGSEMIVWGGDYRNTGGRYNPSTDNWTTTSTNGAPDGRSSHTAVWTGSEMIVWGGYTNCCANVNTGGRYNPSTNSWTAISTTGAPIGRESHKAVWTGSEMIVWGGYDGSVFLNTGGRYNPGTDSWTATSTTNAPAARASHTAVWTGSQMITWGGSSGFPNIFNTGGRYDPSTDSWTATSTTNQPTGRASHTAVWTGSQMITWGGYGNSGFTFDTGGRYDPSTDSWTATSTTNVPAARESHTAVWTGSQMIVWGGLDENFVDLSSGGRYSPAAPSPTPIPSPPPPTPTPTPTPTSTPTSTPTASPTSTPTPSATPARALNLSTRMLVKTGEEVGIGGFIITGSGTKQVLLRGIGPSLGQSGVPDPLADPMMELHGPAGFTTITNDNWRDTQEAEIKATGLAPTNNLESAILVTLTPGAYTAIVKGNDNGTGVGLVEVYDLGPATSQLANISTRVFVGTGDKVLIGGFILGGGENTNVLLRGLGPSLAASGIINYLVDPTFELHDINGSLLAFSDDNDQACSLPPPDPREPCIEMSLPPGAFTVILAGKNGGTGVGLVEIYNLN